MTTKKWKRWTGWCLAISGGLTLALSALGAVFAVMVPDPNWFETVRIQLGIRSFVGLLLFAWGVFWLRADRPRSAN